jgi:hypothetical protein
MNDRVVRLRRHERNIERYQALLKSKLNDVEMRFVEQRLSEEHLALAVLHFMSPASPSKEERGT